MGTHTVPARPAPFSPEELDDFKAQVSPLIGVDLNAYKPRQIERRITALFYRAGVRTLAEFQAQLEADATRRRTFTDGLTINVSEFLRNPERFEELGREVLPALLARHETITVWSAGCSMGAELYSVGMWLEQLGVLDRVRLIGTDLDQGILQKAEVGLYGAHEVLAVPEAWRARYFVPEGPLFRFTGEAIRARVSFQAHNLLADEPLSNVHLILCRNVVIYFNEASKLKLFQGFQRALVPGGVLFVGNTERIFGHRELGLEPMAPFFYRRSPRRDG